MAEVQLPKFGDLLRLYRNRARLTQFQLAEAAGISERAVSDIERCLKQTPHRDTVRRLAEALDLAPQESAEFVQRARRAPQAAVRPAKPQPSSDSALPMYLSSLVGRERDVASICTLLCDTDVRLLTLCGPPGIGKTRLAVRVAGDLRDAFAGGVFFVNLAPLGDPSLVIATIAQTVGVKDAGSRLPFDALTESLRERQALLLLDNFEQVATAGADLANLLAACSQLKVLVTSRAALHVSGEQEVPVPALALPDRMHAPTVEEALRYPAVTLFWQRARSKAPSFEVTTSNVDAIVKICRRLDGLPLAIELAAARINLLPPGALLARLEHRLRVLRGGPSDAPVRHQTLHAAITWSYDLLDDDEQTLFRRLCVFVSGCTLEAAEATSNADGDLTVDILDGLASLVDKSLVRTEAESQHPTAGEARVGHA